jgi:hypothetical protein
VSGIILLVLIGVGVAWLFTRGRKRLNMPVTGKHWIGAIVIVVLVLALLYGSRQGAHGH